MIFGYFIVIFFPRSHLVFLVDSNSSERSCVHFSGGFSTAQFLSSFWELYGAVVGKIGYNSSESFYRATFPRLHAA